MTACFYACHTPHTPVQATSGSFDELFAHGTLQLSSAVTVVVTHQVKIFNTKIHDHTACRLALLINNTHTLKA
jgi:hypothetical protein